MGLEAVPGSCRWKPALLDAGARCRHGLPHRGPGCCACGPRAACCDPPSLPSPTRTARGRGAPRAAVFERLYEHAVSLRHRLQEKKQRAAQAQASEGGRAAGGGEVEGGGRPAGMRGPHAWGREAHGGLSAPGLSAQRIRAAAAQEEEAAAGRRAHRMGWVSEAMARGRDAGRHGNYGLMLYAEGQEHEARRRAKEAARAAQRAADELAGATFAPEISHMAQQLWSRRDATTGTPAWQRLSKGARLGRAGMGAPWQGVGGVAGALPRARGLPWPPTVPPRPPPPRRRRSRHHEPHGRAHRAAAPRARGGRVARVHVCAGDQPPQQRADGGAGGRAAPAQRQRPPAAVPGLAAAPAEARRRAAPAGRRRGGKLEGALAPRAARLAAALPGR
jgi:hypothetical protein